MADIMVKMRVIIKSPLIKSSEVHSGKSINISGGFSGYGGDGGGSGLPDGNPV